MIKCVIGLMVAMAWCKVARDIDSHMELMQELKGDEKDDSV